MFSTLGYYICVPFAWLTRLFYSVTGSYGVALILFTLVVKLVILPFQLKGKKSMLRMNRMQGKIKDIQTRFANDKQRQQQEMADLYAREGSSYRWNWDAEQMSLYYAGSGFNKYVSYLAEADGYAEGAFVVQDPATALAVELLDIKPGQSVLDFCAAPGGKSIHVADRLTEAAQAAEAGAAAEGAGTEAVARVVPFCFAASAV